ncbi:EAL and HDOD domain-containing protein [Marinobacterium sp. YM272]|uniref:EAL and HDOD domain-containing protein n=1 Tax=Marinobacterium sp. YM272 TaxID=3421654 RepID=UPI003D7FBE1B
MSQVLMARQPIFDRKLNVVAYELLYRSDDQLNVANVVDGHHATSNVLVNAYTSIIENQEPKKLPAFLNLPREMFETDSLPAMARKQLVIEVLEDVEVDQTLLDAVKRYREAGYNIALDDFVYRPEYIPLLKLAHIVKLDVLALGMEGIRASVEQLKPYRITLLAEKVETYAQLQECIELGFKLFQGYFLHRPEIVAGRRLESNEAVLLQILAELNAKEPDTARIAKLIEQDPALTYRLLKIVNSASLALKRQVNDIHEAMIILGLSEIQKWISLLALSGQKTKPTELTRQILTVARLSELIAERSPESQIAPSTAFLCGVLDRLDALLDIDREQLLEQIAVSDEIKLAIRERSGPLGELAGQVQALCEGDWEALTCDSPELYQQCQIEALAWTNDTMALIEPA